jgi:signal transduction histidine kinase
MGTTIYKILHLGVGKTQSEDKNRLIVLTNYFAFSAVILSVIILIADAIECPSNFPDLYLSSFSTLFLFLTGIMSLVFNRLRWYILSKLVISILPITLLQLFPLILNMEIDEFYYWYPYGLVVASVVPQIVFSFHTERVFYRICLVYYFIALLFIDNILIYFVTDQVTILNSVLENRMFYKLAPIFSFAFITFAISYLKYTNSSSEKKMIQANVELNNTVEELKTMQQHLVQAEKMASLGTLTGGVAHEINNPLNYIACGLNLIQEFKEEVSLNASDIEKIGMAEHFISEGLNKASAIVKGLMTFSYRGTPILIESDINELIDNTLLFLNSRIGDEILVEKKYKLAEKVPIFQEKIHQVILNVIDNAIFELKGSIEKKKTLEISTEKVEENAVIKIANSGSQIPEGLLHQIFDPFFTTKDPGSGTGLGLSISYSLISEHKGKISAENLENKVCVVIELPLKV